MMFNNDTKWQGNNYNAFQSLSLSLSLSCSIRSSFYYISSQPTMYDDEILKRLFILRFLSWKHIKIILEFYRWPSFLEMNWEDCGS